MPLYGLLLFGGKVTVVSRCRLFVRDLAACTDVVPRSRAPCQNHFSSLLMVGDGQVKMKAWTRIGVLVNQVRLLSPNRDLRGLTVSASSYLASAPPTARRLCESPAALPFVSRGSSDALLTAPIPPLSPQLQAQFDDPTAAVGGNEEVIRAMLALLAQRG